MPVLTATSTFTAGASTATFTPVPAGATGITVITPRHAGEDVVLLLSRTGATLDGVQADVYAVDQHLVSHFDSSGGASAVWQTSGIAPGVYYLKFTVFWSDGSQEAGLVRKVVLRP
jgi:hypothetical protein